MKRFKVRALISWSHTIILMDFCNISILLQDLGSYGFALDLDLSFLACIRVIHNLFVLAILKLSTGRLSTCLLQVQSFCAFQKAGTCSTCERLICFAEWTRSCKTSWWRCCWMRFSRSGCILSFARCVTLCCTLHDLFKILLLLHSYLLLTKGFSLDSSLFVNYSLLFLLQKSLLLLRLFVNPFDLL